MLSLGCQVERRDHKYGVRFRIWDINNTQISSCASLTKRHARPVSAGRVFRSPGEDLFDFRLGNVVLKYVR